MARFNAESLLNELYLKPGGQNKEQRLVGSVLWAVLTSEGAEDLLLAGIRLLLPLLQNLLDRVQQAEDLGKVTEHSHLYQTGIWDQCGNQSKGHLVSQKEQLKLLKPVNHFVIHCYK